MTRIVYDARVLSSSRTGVGRYLEGLLGALRRLAPDQEYLLASDRPLRPELRLDALVHRAWMPKQPWELTALPGLARQLGAAVIHLPQEGFAGRSSRATRVVTVHDLIPLHFQQRYMRNRAHAAWYRARLAAVKRYADVVLTVSHATAQELEDLLGIHPSRIRVIATPVDPRFAVDPDGAARVERLFGLPPDGYFLAVGSADPRKNLERVLLAHADYARTEARPRALALFGHIWRGLPIDELIARHGAPGLVHDVGGVDDDALVALYNGARAMIFPSTYEGYGLPILEAMACGCPVVTSSSGALHEVGGECALFVDPHDVAQLTDAMIQLSESDATRERLAVDGRPWATRHSWDGVAAEVLTAYGLR